MSAMTDAPPPGDPRDALIREQAARLEAQEQQLAGQAERIAGQAERIAGQAERIAALEAVGADLGEQLAAAERAGARDSGNSSMSPSTDDLPGRKPPRKERRAPGRGGKKRKGGEQPGRPGAS